LALAPECGARYVLGPEQGLDLIARQVLEFVDEDVAAVVALPW
jgi:hypothetical protein